jgi:hypothetical protein
MAKNTLLAVMSCALYPERRAAVRETWATQPPPGVEMEFFVGHGPFIPLDTVRLECPDDYASLPQKTFALVCYAVAHGYTRLIKVDDDTFLRLPDALEVLSAADCVAHRRDNPPHNSFVAYPQGGCYSLSLRAMNAVTSEPDLFTTGLEDAAVGRALHRHGIPITHSERIKTDYRLGQPGPDNDIVSAHHVTPAIMRDLHRVNA